MSNLLLVKKAEVSIFGPKIQVCKREKFESIQCEQNKMIRNFITNLLRHTCTLKILTIQLLKLEC